MDENKPKLGDIYLNEYGDTLIICRIDDQIHFMYDDGSFDAINEIPKDFSLIGNHPIQQLFETMLKMKYRSMSIQTQLEYAVAYLGETVRNKNYDYVHNVGTDIRVDQKNSTVFIQLYKQWSGAYEWISVARFLDKYKK